jgi:hypothetical protein
MVAFGVWLLVVVAQALGRRHVDDRIALTCELNT